ncbi:isoflavone reductase-like protein isoform X2 [Cucurbita moschata]|uniref:Isoflavone reductase-like protein isoform X2 n=1 Tax=Cucurbita moschata TaxID=3662 RepID=A0A6J1GNQ2_CUCMO|nr:isoflavone reductase-like protein isoform X2 [Cucurbita moschata]
MAAKSKILIIGGTGYIGKFIVEASAMAGHPTHVLVRGSTLSDPAKSELINHFNTLGVIFVSGDLFVHESLVKAIKQVDVVISTIGHSLLPDQDRIISAIKEAGNVKRFFPSEYGNDVDRVHGIEPARTAFNAKAGIRRAVEAAQIPYTYVSSNFCSGWFLPSLAQPYLLEAAAPPKDKVVILGDGNFKAIFNVERDIATYIIKAVDDPRTLNKILYVRPLQNTYSYVDLVALWEQKYGKILDKSYVSEQQLLNDIQASWPNIWIKEMASKSKILFIGSTGHVGKHVVEASAKASHPTYALVSDSTLSDPTKSHIIDHFKSLKVIFISGDLYNHESLVMAIKQVDVVISTVGHNLLADQNRIISAIKEVGNVKRFFPSEYGCDVDHVHDVEPARTAFNAKAGIRRAVEAAQVPYTFVSSNLFSGWFLPSLAQPYLLEVATPPEDKVTILGDGKAIFNVERDVATYIIKAVDDPRTLNKILYVRPPQNTYSCVDLVALWEQKCGKILDKSYVSEQQLLNDIREASFPLNLRLSIFYSVFVKGDQTNFDIEPSFGVEATKLYPDVEYTTVDEFLNQFV